MRAIRFAFLALLCSRISAQQDSACTAVADCSCNDYRIPAGIMITSSHNKGEWMFSYRYMNMQMSGLMQDSHRAGSTEILKNYEASPDNMRMRMHMLMVMYGISDRLTLMSMLEYRSYYMEMQMQMGKSVHRHAMSSAGLGDTKLYALYALTKKEDHELLISGGLSFPTGSTALKGERTGLMYAGSRYPYSMQAGSGSLEVLPGLSFFRQLAQISWGTQVSSVLRTGYNSIGYKLGNEAALNAWAAWQWLAVLSNSLRLEARYTEKIKGKDPELSVNPEPSANPLNYGGQRVFLYAGAALTGKKGLLRNAHLKTEYGLSLYQHLNGVQMLTKNTFFLSLSIIF
jgi:hypothetical protein